MTTLQPASTQTSTRKLIAIIAPNLLGEDDRELDTDTLRTVLATYTALKQVETPQKHASVATFEISENFFIAIRNSMQIEYGPIFYGTRIVHDASEGVTYLCLTSRQFRTYLAEYTKSLQDATATAITHLNALTEETAILKPLLSLLDTPG